ncbi:hypothetical protein GCM10027516_11780 [Niabella aquatica]
MIIFTILDSFIAGIAGTLLMTLFIRSIGIITGYEFSIPRILGTVLTFETTPSGQVSRRLPVFLLGTAAHYFMGLLFALFYAWLVGSHILQQRYQDGLLFGACAGVLGTTIWYFILRVHRRPPRLPVGLFLIAVFAGHLLFAMGMVAIFNQLSTIF